MPYSELYYHLVWRTRDSEPLIVPRIESQIHQLLWKKALGMNGMVFAIDGIEDHVHVIASLPPALAVAEFIGQVKGYSSSQINKERLADAYFRWQQEYGAFSFDRKRLPYFIAYVKNQKRHHADENTIRVLERTVEKVASEVREPSSTYDLDDTGWRRELDALDEEDRD